MVSGFYIEKDSLGNEGKWIVWSGISLGFGFIRVLRDGILDSFLGFVCFVNVFEIRGCFYDYVW